MTLALPDPPASLTGAPRAFYEELREMLSIVRPTRVDPTKSSVEFDDDGVDVALVHSERADWGVWATVGESDAIVGTGWAHEHFFPPSTGVAEERPWTTQTVDFIAEILRGEIEGRQTRRRSEQPASRRMVPIV